MWKLNVFMNLSRSFLSLRLTLLIKAFCLCPLSGRSSSVIRMPTAREFDLNLASKIRTSVTIFIFWRDHSLSGSLFLQPSLKLVRANLLMLERKSLNA